MFPFPCHCIDKCCYGFINLHNFCLHINFNEFMMKALCFWCDSLIGFFNILKSFLAISYCSFAHKFGSIRDFRCINMFKIESLAAYSDAKLIFIPNFELKTNFVFYKFHTLFDYHYLSMIFISYNYKMLECHDTFCELSFPVFNIHTWNEREKKY